MTYRLSQYTMNTLALPAVIHEEPEISIEELVNSLATLPCAWSRFTGLFRKVYIELLIGAPFYSTVVDSNQLHMFTEIDADGAVPMLNSVSIEPQFLHMSDTVAREAQTMKNEAKMGDAFLLVGQTQFLHGERLLYATVLVGVVPWFNTSMAFNGSTKIDISLVVMNINCANLTYIESRSITRCERVRPLMPIASASDTQPLDEADLHIASKKLLAFLVRWQQTRVALHPDIVKAGVRACDRANVSSAMSRMRVDVDKWRVEQKRSALNNRSFVFFGAGSPRKELFESRHFWQILLFVVSTFATPTLVAFVINEVLDVLRFIIDEEVLVKGELAIYRFCLDYLKPLCDGICTAQLKHLNRQMDEIRTSVLVKERPDAMDADEEDDAQTKFAKNMVQTFLRTNADKLHKAEREKLDMRVETIGEMRAMLASDKRDATSLNAAEIEALAIGDELEVDDIVAQADKRSIREDMTHNIVVVSHNFFCGNDSLMDVLYSASFQRDQLQSRMVMKRGRRYFTLGTALESAVLVTRTFLDWHAHLEANGTRMRPLEEEFSKAAPKTGGLYPLETHTVEFDDIAIGTDDFILARQSCNLADLKEFLAGRSPRMPLPAQFNMAANRGLVAPNALLQRGVPRTGTLHSTANGPIEVHRLALHAICHRDSCYKQKGGAAQHSRQHIDVEYDTAGDPGARFDRLYKLESALPPLSRETFDSAVRAAANGNRAKLDDIEDVVSNMYHNKALPLCVSRFAQFIEENVGDGYLKNEHRLPFYKLMRSFDAPQVTPESIMRFMFRNSPAKMIGVHYHEASKGWEKHAEKSHLKAASSFAEVSLANLREVTSAEAAAATTCAPSCSTMITRQKTCPFLLPDNVVINLLEQTGVPADKIERIMERTGNAGLQCKMHFEYSRPPATRATHAFSDFTRDVYFKHPHQYMLAAADHLLRHKERSVKEEK